MHNNRALKFMLVGGMFFVLFAAGTLGGFAYSYRHRFYPGITVANVSLAGKSQAEGERLVAAQVEKYLNHPVKIVLPDVSRPKADSPNQYETQEVPTLAKDLGLHFSDKPAVQAAWAIGHHRGRTWLIDASKSIFQTYDQPLSYQIDSQAVQTFIDTIVVPKIGTPTPARIVIQNGQVELNPAKPGFSVDKTLLAKQLSTSLQENVTDSDSIYLRAPVSMTDSPVQRAQLQPLVDKLNAIADTKLQLTGDNFSASPKREQILSWFTTVLNDKNQVSLVVQKENVVQYLSAFKTLDQNASQATLLKNLATLVDQDKPKSDVLTLAMAVKPKPVVTPENYTPGKFEGKYVEVVLASQKLYLINGANLEKTYVVSTGKWSTPTPVGTFTIHGKSKRAYSAMFGLYMPYWQNFLNGEYGLHELPEWPNGYKEGQGHLGVPVSHGCVRLGVGDAEQVYNWTTDGTPVYIH